MNKKLRTSTGIEFNVSIGFTFKIFYLVYVDNIDTKLKVGDKSTVTISYDKH